MGKYHVKENLVVANKIHDTHQLQLHESALEEKYQRKVNNNELKQMLNEQMNDLNEKQKNVLTLERSLLNDLSKFDVQVDDIVEEKRKVMDKLREDRPF